MLLYGFPLLQVKPPVVSVVLDSKSLDRDETKFWRQQCGRSARWRVDRLSFGANRLLFTLPTLAAF